MIWICGIRSYIYFGSLNLNPTGQNVAITSGLRHNLKKLKPLCILRKIYKTQITAFVGFSDHNKLFVSGVVLCNIFACLSANIPWYVLQRKINVWIKSSSENWAKSILLFGGTDCSD